ncbi:MAG: Uma2 family endonuclease [Treponema sp.]|nr:Uma2 family endonuclease [Treponema sp.]
MDSDAGLLDPVPSRPYTLPMADSAVFKEQYEQGRRFSYADYKGWELDQGERYELIYGEAYALAAPNTYHQSILMELGRQFANYFAGKPCKVFPAPFDVRLFYEEDESDDTVVQPDISVVCDREKLGKEGCRGAPDFVAEILSPSNSAIEMQRKYELYREAGVREYWVIDPEHKTLHCYRFSNGTIFPRTYRSSDTAEAGIFPGLAVELEPVFAE